MGVSGNRPGHKIFSISTTIRNPVRNERFMLDFLEFDGKEFDAVWKEYFRTLISDGTYKFSKKSEVVRNKILAGIKLTDEEIDQLCKDNPQRTGAKGRVMTELRSMKDQGFLKFWPKPDRPKYISTTKLGRDLLSGNENPSDVYCRAMIGLHAHNPSRPKMFNRSRPFLNTLFVIREVEKLWFEMGHTNTGIAAYELSTFVLTMNDCDYLATAKEIINYRKRNKEKLKYDREYLINYAKTKRRAINANHENIHHEYPDDVFRKFQMTQLLEERGKGSYKFYSFSEYNKEKVQAILNAYKNYYFMDFNNQDEYYAYLESIKLPWELDPKIRIHIAKTKATNLNIKSCFTEEDYLNNIVKVEKKLDEVYYNSLLSKMINSFALSSIRKELLILSDSCKEKSVYENTDESIRLEYFLALMIGKKYGEKYLVSNMMLNPDGSPLRCAGGYQADIAYRSKQLSFIMEPTMRTAPTDLMKYESTGVCEHYLDELKCTPYLGFGMLIAPRSNARITRFYRFEAKEENINVIPYSIDAFVDMMDKSPTLNDFAKLLNNYLKDLCTNKPEDFSDKINKIKLSA